MTTVTKQVQRYATVRVIERALLDQWGDDVLARVHEELAWEMDRRLGDEGWVHVPGQPVLMHEDEDTLRNQVRVVAEARVYDRWPDGCRAAVEEDQAWIRKQRGD